MRSFLLTSSRSATRYLITCQFLIYVQMESGFLFENLKCHDRGLMENVSEQKALYQYKNYDLS